MENKEEKNICKCPSCGASLKITSEEFGKLDDDEQRDEMEEEFNKKMGKLEEYD